MKILLRRGSTRLGLAAFPSQGVKIDEESEIPANSPRTYRDGGSTVCRNVDSPIYRARNLPSNSTIVKDRFKRASVWIS
jgi:hypothetical protein